MTTQDKFPQAELEAMLDVYGVHRVISELSDIAYGKAEHLQDNWQDKPAATQWSKLGRRLCAVADWAKYNVP